MEKSIWQQLKPTNQFQRMSIVSYLLKKQEILRRYETKSFFLHLSPCGHILLSETDIRFCGKQEFPLPFPWKEMTQRPAFG